MYIPISCVYSLVKCYNEEAKLSSKFSDLALRGGKNDFLCYTYRYSSIPVDFKYYLAYYNLDGTGV